MPAFALALRMMAAAAAAHIRKIDRFLAVPQ
jgi:hypothetical protein